MQNLTLRSNAKVNLSLDVLGVKNSGPQKGHHFIQTVFCEITPQNTHGFQPDIIHIRVSGAKKNEIKISGNLPKSIDEKDNTLIKAAEIILKNYCKNSHKKIEIEVEKNIPISSGLGGGSSNGATVLKALNEILNLELTTKKLESLAVNIGMDAPFFIRGGIALGENFGEIITPLPKVNGLSFTIFPFSGDARKTESAYKKLDLSKCAKNADKTLAIIHAIKTNDSFAIHRNIHNDFETILKSPLPQNHHLSGSGPTVFILA
ncbi:MAG TPA: 4-(cytidine 5'-diphospho)-2-C-methyl-D-erythritol kinase [Candidatus Gracilibacteria bacterium]|nr:4-(cytidine 5'-diphospho)-2-C-methyl-D-erythritol kinase [Candidatus Gracilibacteria bacterium]